jgi:hypothetical protein
MKLLQKHFPALKKIDGITMLSGKPYINHPGLLFLAQGMIESKTTRMLDISNAEKGDFYFECLIITTDGRTFNGHGNGNSGNIKGVAKNRAFEMAEVRSQNRALRSMLALGDTTAEEIDEGAALHGDADAIDTPKPKAKAKPKTEPTPDPAKEHDKDWERDRNFFQMKVKKIGFTYEEVCYIMQILKKDRPSQMNELARANLLGWLENLSEQTRDRYKDDFMVDCQGAPSEGERHE